ncbi:hypothetical protein PH213_40985 [Streptomyces sp. SRF1]|nr:hypothetical protein [Streptomyces sp. SRF1]MDN3060780.1 hypothetical protein [Streptomyces sp. SRF1]
MKRRTILPVEDMPFLEDGIPVDIILGGDKAGAMVVSSGDGPDRDEDQ